MSTEIDFDQLLGKYKSDPYDYIDVHAVHTGIVHFTVQEGDSVQAASGEWQHIPGTSVYEIERERNLKKISADVNGTVSYINQGVEGKFVEAGEKLLTIRHPLKKKEIIENILKDVLFLFPAPERAKYFFSLDIQSRIEKQGAKSVTIHPGDEIFTMSLMKRDTPVYYEGEPGVIHSVYFKPGISIEQGAPLIGVCAPDKVALIRKIIARVKADWDQAA